MSKQTSDALPKFLIVGGLFFLIALVGSSTKTPWPVIPVATVGTAALGYFSAKGDKRTKVETAVRWGILGAIFGTLAFLAS